jgi:hypothetical protein
MNDRDCFVLKIETIVSKLYITKFLTSENSNYKNKKFKYFKLKKKFTLKTIGSLIIKSKI